MALTLIEFVLKFVASPLQQCEHVEVFVDVDTATTLLALKFSIDVLVPKLTSDGLERSTLTSDARFISPTLSLDTLHEYPPITTLTEFNPELRVLSRLPDLRLI